MRSGSWKIITTMTLSAFGVCTCCIADSPPTIKVRDNQDTVQIQENTVGLRHNKHICTGCYGLSTAPNQIPIQFVFTITQIAVFCKYKKSPCGDLERGRNFLSVILPAFVHIIAQNQQVAL